MMLYYLEYSLVTFESKEDWMMAVLVSVTKEELLTCTGSLREFLL